MTLRKYIFLSIAIFLILSSSGLATSGLVASALNNTHESDSLTCTQISNRSLATKERNNAVSSENGNELKLGYYKVYDVYPSGEKVLRGVAPFGTPIQSRQPKVAEEEYDNPLGSKYFWLTAKQSVFLYIYSEDLLFPKNIIATMNSEGSVDINASSTRVLGSDSFVAIIDYGSDGIDDLILMDQSNQIIVVNGSNLETITTISRSTSTEEVFYVSTGDVDDDGLFEIVFVCSDSSGYSSFYLRIVDDWKNSFKEIKKIDITEIKPDESLYHPYSRIDLYDIDNDGAAEILFTTTSPPSASSDMKCFFLILDDKSDNFKVIADLSDDFDAMFRGYPAFVTAGNFAEGKSTEMVVVTGNSWYAWLYYFRYNLTTYKTDFIDKFYLDFSVESIAAGDIDDDPQDELIIASPDFSGSYFEVLVVDFGLTSIDKNTVSWKPSKGGNIIVGHSINRIKVVTTNVDDDEKSEIAVAYVYDDDLGEIAFLDDKSGHFDRLAVKSWDVKESLFGSSSDYSVMLHTLCVGDKILLRYTGIHNQSMSAPYIIAVMAAPPTIKGIAQNYGSSATSFGTAVSRSTSESNGYSVSVGVTLSYEASDIFDIVEVHASATFTAAFERTHTITETIQECRDFIGDYGNDYVIFETVMYDNYYYEVIAHPKKEYVGQIMAISVPTKPAVYKWTVDFFNENNMNYPDIGSETFNHTIGQVWTYPTREDMEHLYELYGNRGFWKSRDTMTVGAGEGSNGIEIDLEHEETTETSTTIGIEFEAGFAIAGVGLSVSTGLSSTYVYAITVGKSTKYRGDVGDIAPSYYNEYKYSFGLFVYNLYREKDHLAYQVVNYWVEDYNGPHEVNSPIADVIYDNPSLADFTYKVSLVTGLTIETALAAFITGIILSVVGVIFVVLRLRRGKKTGRIHKKRKKK
ncbi:MAG: hypothetical protein J7L07_12185 [Candidatus Odinarchaeota archaeon]|nr:hypothetical protein [Candidatus Odinarchaeota archaeon]